MAFDIAKAIESLGKAVDSGFSFAEKSKETQSETEIIKINKRYVKAINAAERLILLTYRYYNSLSEKDQREYNDLIERFIRYNQ